MKYAVKLTGPHGGISYLSHRGKTSFGLKTARRYMAEWLACNGGTAQIEEA
jgi:hypothetical protein